MGKQILSPPLLCLVLVIVCLLQTCYAQTAAQGPAPAGPANITKILEKAGQFSTLIKILKVTQESDRMNAQLNSSSNQGLTLFAPTDNAFSNLKAGTLNSINSQQQLQLVQFHILPTLYTISQFQTASNPLHTQAGNSDYGQFPLNVTTSSSGNQVNLTTGVVTTSVSNTIYSDNHLAVYQVDQVLLPLALFGSPPTASPAPAPTKPQKNVRPSDAPSASSDDASGVVPLNTPPLLFFFTLLIMPASSLFL